MIQNFEVNSKQIDLIKKITKEEKKIRIKNLEFFKSAGFPSKKLEDWKFSDFKTIIDNNFDKLEINNVSHKIEKIDLLKEFEHNYIFLVNGYLHSSNFDYEDKIKIKINSYDSSIDAEVSRNPLVCLNHAFAENGYSLEIDENYKLKKVVVVYNIFTDDISNKILNSKNKIKIKENSELHLIEYIINKSKFKFVNNLYENVILEKNSKFKNIYMHSNKSNGFFHKFLKNKFLSNSDYSNLIFSSGLKFNKLDINCDLEGENVNCNILSALLLNDKEHNEIKTCINHLAPNCTSFQKVKNVLGSDSKGIFQGKIHVKDIAQKTDAYQLSRALLLNNDSEFNSKPELEIYAEDVKCSHGSTTGNIEENSIFYLMSRGLSKEQAKKMLVEGFLKEAIETITEENIKLLILESFINRINKIKI